ncbi:redoxin domain-containing protein [Puniceicoccales bacterium CK1056]|uniref:Redoxin domain-containing protein n=1 Tax=Oceanipulchritudo coccoides TaxID=2706888 RepID=A0A6B2LYU0_9BACT|nr:redoxin domain-containing protein [Oceanipulchritudo coccoides]NDV61788.1 redoxin domain-containing protein [Oceanipulchritudo coccoides]
MLATPFTILGFALVSCNPQVMCSTDQPANTSVYQPGHLEPLDSASQLRVGDKAPDFILPSLSGSEVRLYDELAKHPVVITFVPAAWTPVCSEQWPGYNVAQPLFEELGVCLMGITTDNLPTLYAWTQEMGGVWFKVLSDFYPHGQVCSEFGILRSDGTSERALFVIDQEGVIRYIDIHNINERPPLEDLIEALKKL